MSPIDLHGAPLLDRQDSKEPGLFRLNGEIDRIHAANEKRISRSETTGRLRQEEANTWQLIRDEAMVK